MTHADAVSFVILFFVLVVSVGYTGDAAAGFGHEVTVAHELDPESNGDVDSVATRSRCLSLSSKQYERQLGDHVPRPLIQTGTVVKSSFLEERSVHEKHAW